MRETTLKKVARAEALIESGMTVENALTKAKLSLSSWERAKRLAGVSGPTPKPKVVSVAPPQAPITRRFTVEASVNPERIGQFMGALLEHCQSLTFKQ